MGMSAGGGGGGPMADINVTPLVDVMLVLIIIFMVITPVLTSGVAVSLPKAESGDESQDVGQHINISVKSDESLFVEEKESSVDELISDVNDEYAKDGARSLLIKADKRLTWKSVHAVMQTLHDNGMSTMLLAVEKQKGDAEAED
jgi:biopolymer transport protein ExbD